MARSEDSHPRSSRESERDEKREPAKKEDEPKKADDADAKMKAWVRAEISMAASGVTEEERAKRNP